MNAYMTNDKIGLPALTRKLRGIENCLAAARAVPEPNARGIPNRQSDYI